MMETPPLPKSSDRTLTLRPARPEDAPDAAPLIHAAGPLLFNHMFGPREADVRRFFAALFRRPRNPFSFENGIVAEIDGQVVGLAICADATERRRIGRRMLWLAPRLRGPFALLRRFPHIMDVIASGSDPPPNAYYLSILAVAPAHRRTGIGSRLLHEVRRRAETAGCACIALHTEIGNEAAQRLYARHGYVETLRKPAARTAQTGLTGFVAMECALE
jgi:ribosomal protein S18 acetylase RimI-like enzyme